MMFPYKWYLKDGYPEKNGRKVFSTFACGGGSTMGYKLAGYDVIGANDIDPQMARVYKENHHPKYFYQCGIKDLLNMELPSEFNNIDILDGSPPCSTFSMAGSREKKWGSKHKFREGQAEQVLDDLFFQFIDLAGKLKPKVIIAENVKGMLLGNAKGYILEIKKRLQDLDYKVQIFLLNAATMGVPQTRERVFVLARKKEFHLPDIKLEFKEKPITFGEVKEPVGVDLSHTERWKLMKFRRRTDRNINSINLRMFNKTSGFNAKIEFDNEVKRTITSGDIDWRYSDGMGLTKNDYIVCGTFPMDYNFLDIEHKYLIGMSVPPVMMAQISYQVYNQWLKNI